MTDPTGDRPLDGVGVVGDPSAPPDPHAAGAQRTVGAWARWTLRKTGMILIGVVVWAAGTGTFSRWSAVHSQVYVWIFLGIVSLIALLAWIRSERE